MSMFEKIDLTKLLNDRCTCRSFKPNPIPRDVMNYLYDMACSAPSSGGFQRISIIEIQENEKKKRLAYYSRNQQFIVRAPVNLVFCIDFRRMKRIAEYEGAPYDQGAALSRIWMGIIDASISAHTLALAAEAQGLRSCYNGNIIDQVDKVAELLELPEGVIPAFMLTLGYPLSAGKASLKYARDVIVQHEIYQDMGIEQLHQYHRKKFSRSKFNATLERCEKLHKILARQYGEENADKEIEQVKKRGYLTAYQYWFGCYYPNNEKDIMTDKEYYMFLAKNGLDFERSNKT